MSDVFSESTPSIAIPSKTNETETSNSVQITTIRLNGDNFLRWSQLDAENSMVMTWLMNSMDEDISSNYMCYPMTKVLWFSYFNSLKRVWQDLDLFSDYEWKSVKDCNHNNKSVEENCIFKFLKGLNIEFVRGLRGRIIGRHPLSLIGEVFSEVRREERHKNVMLGKRAVGPPVENSALVASDANASTAITNQRKTDDKPRCGATVATNFVILRKPAGRFMANQQIGKVANLVKDLTVYLPL
ncbi:hypothetical protein UlMin_038176 [Ulmus minor]